MAQLALTDETLESHTDRPHTAARSHPAATSREVAELVEQNLPLVGHLVRETLSKVPAHVSRDELTSAAMMALVVSAQGFDTDRGVPFARFAAIRIRGALMDELRGMDWAARSVRGRAREVEVVRTRLTSVLGRTPTTDELASTTGMSVAELDTLSFDVARATVLRLQGFSPETSDELLAERDAGPEALLLIRERLGYLHDAINALPERLRFVVVEYFFAQRQMTDIAEELGVTESRISQLRAEALRLLRDGMNSQLEPTAVPDDQRPGGRAAAGRSAYFEAIAERSTLAGRLALTSARGDMLPSADLVRSNRAAHLQRSNIA